MPSQEASPARSSPPMPTCSGYTDDDYRTMLAKIASLQEANVAMQQKLQVRRATKPRRVQLFVIITSCANLDK